jgi:hypothetical protein
MWRSGLILLLGLVSSVQPVGAQSKMVTHWLTVSVHPAVYPKVHPNEVEDILKGASDLLQGKHTDITPPNNCQVEFKFKRFIPWTSGPADITDDTDLEQVQEVPADVKVVQNITYCAPGNGGYAGCAWRPKSGQRTVIVARSQFSPSIGNGPVIWAHEYGHTTGLIHRNEADSENLMSPCVLQVFNVKIDQSECGKFRAGPVSKYPPTLGPGCPAGHPND